MSAESKRMEKTSLIYDKLWRYHGLRTMWEIVLWLNDYVIIALYRWLYTKETKLQHQRTRNTSLLPPTIDMPIRSVPSCVQNDWPGGMLTGLDALGVIPMRVLAILLLLCAEKLSATQLHHTRGRYLIFIHITSAQKHRLFCEIQAFYSM